MTPTPDDAQARRIVRLPDGTTGRLTYCPAPDQNRRTRTKRPSLATVAMNGGCWHAHLPATDLTLVDPEPGTLVELWPAAMGPEARPIRGTIVVSDAMSVTIDRGMAVRRVPRHLIARIKVVGL